MLSAFFLVVRVPFTLGMFFLSLLLMRSLCVGLINGFVGLLLFIVYVGGTIVLFTYCFILTPRSMFSKIKNLSPLTLFVLYQSFMIIFPVGMIFEFYWISGMLLLIGLMLFVVILRVVDIVDFSQGSIRVECD